MLRPSVALDLDRAIVAEFNTVFTVEQVGSRRGGNSGCVGDVCDDADAAAGAGIACARL
jgi:hypothetical protein